MAAKHSSGLIWSRQSQGRAQVPALLSSGKPAAMHMDAALHASSPALQRVSKTASSLIWRCHHEIGADHVDAVLGLCLLSAVQLPQCWITLLAAR